MLTQTQISTTPRLPILLAQETLEQPLPTPLPQPIASGPWTVIVPIAIVGAFFLGELAGVFLRAKLDANPELKKRVENFEQDSKGMARNAARIIQVAEVLAPPLRATPIDNHIAAALIAYANSNISFFKETEALHTTPEEVAEFVDAACPELLGKCIDLPVSQASAVMRQVAKETVAAKVNDSLDTESESFKQSKARVEELLLSLGNKNG